MSKPDDIPQDVWDTATELAAELRSAVVWHSNSANEVIATALARVRLAERERCFGIAALYADHPEVLMREAGCEIANAIRGPQNV